MAKTLASMAVGSTVKLKVDGTLWDFIVVHQGRPSSLYDVSCDGTWLLMKDIYKNRQWHGSYSTDILTALSLVCSTRIFKRKSNRSKFLIVQAVEQVRQ